MLGQDLKINRTKAHGQDLCRCGSKDQSGSWGSRASVWQEISERDVNVPGGSADRNLQSGSPLKLQLVANLGSASHTAPQYAGASVPCHLLSVPARLRLCTPRQSMQLHAPSEWWPALIALPVCTCKIACLFACLQCLFDRYLMSRQCFKCMLDVRFFLKAVTVAACMQPEYPALQAVPQSLWLQFVMNLHARLLAMSSCLMIVVRCACRLCSSAPAHVLV